MIVRTGDSEKSAVSRCMCWTPAPSVQHPPRGRREPQQQQQQDGTAWQPLGHLAEDASRIARIKLAALCPLSLLQVLETLQVAGIPNLYAIGDAADTRRGHPPLTGCNHALRRTCKRQLLMSKGAASLARRCVYLLRRFLTVQQRGQRRSNPTPPDSPLPRGPLLTQPPATCRVEKTALSADLSAALAARNILSSLSRGPGRPLLSTLAAFSFPQGVCHGATFVPDIQAVSLGPASGTMQFNSLVINGRLVGWAKALIEWLQARGLRDWPHIFFRSRAHVPSASSFISHASAPQPYRA